MSAPRPRNAKDLQTSIPLLLPSLILSCVAGALIEVSPWFGGTIVLQLLAIGSEFRGIVDARKVTVKIIEVFLLVVLIPIIAAMSMTSSSMFSFPLATRILNLLLISFATPQLTLLWRTRTKLNNSVVLVYATVLILASFVTIGCNYDRGFIWILPALIMTIYSMTVASGVIYLLRNQIGLAAMRWISLAATVISFIACIVSSFFAYQVLFYLLVAATILFAIMHTSFECAHDWNRVAATSYLPGLIVWTKIVSSVMIALSFFIGLATRWNLVFPVRHNDELAAIAYVFAFIFLFLVHIIFPFLIFGILHEERSLREEQSQKKTAACLAAIVVAVAMMISIGYYYCTTSHPASIHEKFLLVILEILFLTLIYLLKNTRAVLVRYYFKLLFASLGFAVYLIGYAIFGERSTIPGFSRVVKVTIFVCLNLFAYFWCGLIDQYERKEAAAKIARVAARNASQAAVAVNPAPVVLPVVERDVDSDYDSDDNNADDGVAQAAV